MLTAACIFVQRNKRRKKFWRNMKKRAIENQILKEKQFICSIKIQTWWCNLRVRLRFLKTLAEHKRLSIAVTKIQALYRGYIFRYLY